MVDIETTAVEGIDADDVTAWFATHVPEARPPLPEARARR